MQDPLTSSFRWGETFDTAPSPNQPGRYCDFRSTTDAQIVRPYRVTSPL